MGFFLVSPTVSSEKFGNRSATALPSQPFFRKTLMNFLVDLGETNKIDLLAFLFTRFQEKPKKRETTSRLEVFPRRAIVHRLSNFSGENIGDTSKEPDFLVDLSEMNNFYF